MFQHTHFGSTFIVWSLKDLKTLKMLYLIVRCIQSTTWEVLFFIVECTGASSWEKKLYDPSTYNYQKPMKVDIIHSSTPGQRVSLSLGKIMHPCMDLGDSHICSNEVLHLQDISIRTYYLLWIRIFVNFTIFFSRIFCPILA